MLPYIKNNMAPYKKKMSTRSRKPTSARSGVSNSVKKYVKSVTRKARPEMKFIATAPLNLSEPTILTSASNPGFVWREFTNPSQGTGASNRIGNEIYLHGYHSKISYYNNSTASAVYIRRLVVGYVNVNVDAGTASAELFDIQGTGTNFSLLNNMGVIQHPINTSQFKVYSDKTFKLGALNGGDATHTRMVNSFTKFGGKKICFENNGTGLSQDWRVAEIIFAVAANNDATVGDVEYNQYARMFFTDP